MINKEIKIKIDYEGLGVKPTPVPQHAEEREYDGAILTSYILDERNVTNSLWNKRPAVIVCPGGGYELTSDREAEPIALEYCAAGMHAFILDYSVSPCGWPVPLCELSKAIEYVKSIADENNIDKDRIFVCGFSAGGHLVASLGVHHSHPDVLKYSGVKKGDNIPAGLILGYPVITNDKDNTHWGTINNFMAGREELYDLAGLEKHVTSDTPPTFLWHTSTDEAVPVVSSLRFATALYENNVKFELHIYPKGEHGLGLGNDVTASWEDGVIPCVQDWVDLSVRWIKELK